MVMKLNKSVFRVMRENKGQYVGMLAMVLLSSYLFVMFALLATNLSVNKNAFVEEYVQGDLEFFAASKVENISVLERDFGLTMQETIVAEKTNNGKTVRLFTTNEKVNIPAVLDGRLPNTGEIALDPQFVNANGLVIGGGLELDGKRYVISGIICLPNYAYILQKEGDLVNNPNEFGIGVLNRKDLTVGNYLYSVKFDVTQSNIYKQAKPLKAAINDQNAGILTWNYAKYDMKTAILDVEVLAITVYSFVLPPVLMFISAVLVAVVLGRMVKNHEGVIGTLYALGYRKKEIMRHYMTYPLMLGFAGGALGGVFGIYGFVSVLDLMLSFFPMPIKQISYNPLFIILSVALSVLILCAGTYIALNKVLKNPPVSLMRKEGKERKLNVIERKLKLGSMGFSRKFSIREQMRSLPRLVFLIIGVLAATMLLMFGLVLKSSLDFLINQGTNNAIDYNYEYVMNWPQTVPPIGGEPVAGMKFVPDFDLNNRFEIVGISPKTQMVSLADTKGNPITIDDDRVIVSKTMARKYGLSIGDTIAFTDIIYDKENSITITHIADTSVGDVIFTSIDNFCKIIGWEKGSYNAVISYVPLDFDDGMIYMTKTPEKLSEGLAEYMTLMNTVLYGIAIIAALIGLIIMYILASISIDENKGNISLMKAFGYKKKEVGSLLVNGSRVFVACAFVAGVPLAFITIGQFLAFVFDLIGLTIETRLDWYFVLLGFALIYLAFEFSKAACMKKVGRVSMSEALKAQRE